MKDKSVLIVDDEKNILLTLSQSSEVQQVEIETAVNGEKALAKLREKDLFSSCWTSGCREWTEGQSISDPALYLDNWTLISCLIHFVTIPSTTA